VYTFLKTYHTLCWSVIHIYLLSVCRSNLLNASSLSFKLIIKETIFIQGFFWKISWQTLSSYPSLKTSYSLNFYSNGCFFLFCMCCPSRCPFIFNISIKWRLFIHHSVCQVLSWSLYVVSLELSKLECIYNDVNPVLIFANSHSFLSFQNKCFHNLLCTYLFSYYLLMCQ